ncbi:hypothetical protein [Pedobacter sp. B4-66]|uniref:hypothetical protein n=1 Tax=Pedobacter sp. B4-66 TaxID=2817280 RepID=UPI001BDB39AB|nr:hypothetical protein [Pedobacter sp. B4-66]
MKKFSLITLSLLAYLNTVYGQNNTIVVGVDMVEPKTPTFKVTSALPLTADFSKPVIIKFDGTTLPAGYKVTKAAETTDDLIQDTGDLKIYTITVKNLKATEIKLKIDATDVPTLDVSIKNTNVPNEKIGTGSASAAYKFFKAHFGSMFTDFDNRYDRDGNKAYFFFDENGTPVGPVPVNVDADDYMIVYVAIPKGTDGIYAIKVEGEYKGKDLVFRPGTPIPTGATQGKTPEEDTGYDYIIGEAGPFSPEKATIKIFKMGDELSSLNVPINELYHGAFGVSFISTRLEKPVFDVFPINGTDDNTINTTNKGIRTLVTFNYIFYWKPSIDWLEGKLKKSSNITRGRDVLKEATFLERLNPMFGVSINSEWRENFFVGGNFEFVRGGSISAGYHYGKIQQLVDKSFVLGQDVFTGTKADIKLTDAWKWDFFFGLTLDTRIFSRIFARN